MKKLNNRGITTIEVLICFVLVVLITSSMYSTISTFNEKRLLESYKSKIYTYKNLLTKEIQNDFIKKGLTHASYSRSVAGATTTYIVDCELKNGEKRQLVVSQTLGKSDYHIGGKDNADDSFMIKYGPPTDLIEYPIPELGESKNASGHTIKDLSINNILIDIDEDNILSIYIGFYHPELGTRYGINIISPIDYITTGADSAASFKVKDTEESSYTIKFDANGGTGSADNITAKLEEYVTLPAGNTFKRNGYDLVSWNTEKDGSGINYALGSAVKSVGESNMTTTLYAMWDVKGYEYNYTGGVQTFKAPTTGRYRLEVWGASGGAKTANQRANSHAGLGGYATGYIQLNAGDTLYVVVGGKGKFGSGPQAGGYNGGGTNGKTTSNPSGSGGGATHIAFASGVLKNLSGQKNKVIIVAGGGGGSDNGGTIYLGDDDGSGGNGGGHIGTPAYIAGKLCDNPLKIAPAVSAGGCGMGGTQNSHFFGYGESPNISSDTGGAGGGWYGGYVTNHYNGGAGGGSGYINLNYLSDASMYCFDCTTSNEAPTKTFQNNESSEQPISKQSKIGDGFAKISLIP